MHKRHETIDKVDLWLGSCPDVAEEYPDDHIQLLLTSTPYPGQRGFEVSVEEYRPWLLEQLKPWFPKMKQGTGVIVQNIFFKRTDDGWFDDRIYTIPYFYRHFGWHMIDTYIWDKINTPPSGNHQRHDRPGYEFCWAFARSKNYVFRPQRKPYSAKTIGKAKTGNMRQADVDGSLAGGHAKLHPDGALVDNVLRISSSGDQGRPRVKGGVFPRELARRFILTFTEPEDVVLDPFCGSGTALVEAVRADRAGIGIDIDEAAIKVTADWLQTEFAQQWLLAPSGDEL